MGPDGSSEQVLEKAFHLLEHGSSQGVPIGRQPDRDGFR